MREEQKEMLKSYLDINVAPILIDVDLPFELENIVVIPSNISLEQLNGNYSETQFEKPTWYLELMEKRGMSILLIANLDEIPKDEQVKFIDILKYRKIGSFLLPNDCRVVITANKINKDTIHKDIYSLVAHIER